MPVFIDGHHLITPTSVAKTGTGSTATINTNGSVTFSSCETLSLNGVFTADYDNYIIIMRHRHDSATNGPAVYARLRSSGTDSTTGYTWQFVFADSTAATGLRSTTEGYARIGMTDNTLRSGLVAWIYGPFLAQPTAFRNVSVTGYANAALIDYATTHSASTSYDGITFSTGLGPFGGLVCVYGAVK